MISSICNVNGFPIPVNSNGVTGVNVSSGSIITVSLANSAGVNNWTINCTSTDGINPNSTVELVNATKVQNLSNYTCEFTVPISDGYIGSALQFTSTINNINTSTFGIFVLNSNATRLFFGGETLESNSTYGVSYDLNLLYSIGGSGESQVLGGDVVGLLQSNSVTKIQGIPVISTPILNDGYALVSSGGEYVPTGVAPVYNVKNFGAIGNGISDDTIAIQNAEIERSISNGILYFPPGTYLISQELKINNNVCKWVGNSISYSSNITVIKANSNIRSCVNMASAYNHISGIEFNANNLALYGIYRQGDSFSTYTNILCTNALLDGWNATGTVDGYNINIIANSGNTSPLLTLTSPYGPIGAYTFILTITNTGGLGSGTFIYSSGGGNSRTFTIPSTGTVSLADTNSPGSNNIASGIVVKFPPGTYSSGDFYTISSTYSSTNNDSSTFNDCSGVLNGRVHASSGVLSTYTALLGFTNAILAPGTVSTVEDGYTITGSGTNFSSLGIRIGDFITISGTAYQILNVPSDTIIDIGYRNQPQSNESNLDYAISVGNGYYESLHNDNNIATLNGGLWRNNSGSGIYCMGLYGPSINKTQCDGNAVCGITIGIDNNATLVIGSSIIRPYFEQNIFAGFYCGSCNGVALIQPNTGIPNVFFVANIFSTGTAMLNTGLVPIGQSVSTIPVTTAVGQGLTFTLPGLLSTPAILNLITTASSFINPNNSTLVELDAGSDLILTSTPTILAATNTIGQLLLLYNEGSFTITLQDDGTLSGSNLHLKSSSVTLSRFGSMLLLYLNGAWNQIV